MLRAIYRLWELLTLPVLAPIRPPRVGAACIVLDELDRVLLVRQTYRGGWHLPGGGVNRKERLEEAARREAWEETGVVAEEPLELWGAYTYIGNRYTDHIVVYIVRRWERVEKRSLEIAETRFFALDALPENMSPGIRRRLDEIAGRRDRSLSWN